MNIPNPLDSWFNKFSGFHQDGREPGGPLDLIGLDMAPSRRELGSQTWVPAIAAIVLASLLLAGLRMSIVRLRYAVAEGVSVEQELLAEKRDMTVSLLRLREPKQLAEQAKSLGFAAPDRVINLYKPTGVKLPVATLPVSPVSNRPRPDVSGSRP